MKIGYSRPTSVTILTGLVLIIAVINLVRFAHSLLQWNFLRELLPVPPLYLAATGLIWGGLGLVLVYGLLRGMTWAPLFTRLVFPAYFLVFWLDRLFLASPLSREANLMFAVAGTIVILIWVFWTLSRRNVKLYFGETHER
jgi:hypothetical protein